jgi:hypothetical protein
VRRYALGWGFPIQKFNSREIGKSYFNFPGNREIGKFPEKKITLTVQSFFDKFAAKYNDKSSVWSRFMRMGTTTNLYIYYSSWKMFKLKHFIPNNIIR